MRTDPRQAWSQVLEPGAATGRLNPDACQMCLQRGREDSNLQPSVPKTGALSIELRPLRPVKPGGF